MICYLRMGSDYLEASSKCRSIQFAKAEFMAAASELDRYGQKIEGSIHIAASMDVMDEYPDYVLSLGPRGGLQCQST